MLKKEDPDVPSSPLALSHYSAEHAIKSKPIAELTKYEESHYIWIHLFLILHR